MPRAAQAERTRVRHSARLRARVAAASACLACTTRAAAASAATRWEVEKEKQRGRGSRGGINARDGANEKNHRFRYYSIPTTIKILYYTASLPQSLASPLVQRCQALPSSPGRQSHGLRQLGQALGRPESDHKQRAGNTMDEIISMLRFRSQYASTRIHTEMHIYTDSPSSAAILPRNTLIHHPHTPWQPYRWPWHAPLQRGRPPPHRPPQTP